MKTENNKTEGSTAKNAAVKNNSVVIICLILFGIFSENSYAISDALKIKIWKGSYSDETIIRFMPGASPEYDACCDAYKLFSTNNNVPNVFTKTPFGDALAINALPELTTTYTTGLFLRIGTSGSYSFSTKELGAFAPGVCIMMFDQITGSFYDLRDTTTINHIYLPAISKNDPARFIIVFSLPASVTITNASCLGCDDGMATIKKSGFANWQYTVTDTTTGNLIASGISPSESMKLKHLHTGVYKVIIQSQSFTCSDLVWFNIQQGYNNALKTSDTDSHSQPDCKINYYDGAFHLQTDFNSSKNFSAQIVDLSGRIIWKRDFSDIIQLNEAIDIAKPAAGIYIWIIQGSDFYVVKKILIP